MKAMRIIAPARDMFNSSKSGWIVKEGCDKVDKVVERRRRSVWTVLSEKQALWLGILEYLKELIPLEKVKG